MSKSNFPAATRTMERYMVDTVMIYNPQDIDEQAVDPTTLALIPGAEDVLYEGKALVSPMGDPGDQLVGLGPRTSLYYTVALPVVDVDFPPDCLMIVTKATNDSQMQDKQFTIEGQIPSSISVYKRLRARLDVDAA
jgi:hypothetical protein